MRDIFNWAMGIRRPPEWAQGGSWRLEFQALPRGSALAVAMAAAVAAAALVWWLYRREGRQLSVPVRLTCAALRYLVMVGVTFMLLELAVVITRREQVPAHLPVLLDCSRSMSLPDGYADEAVARAVAAMVGMASPDGTVDLQRLRQAPRIDLVRARMADLWPELSRGRELSRYAFAGELTPLSDETELSSRPADGPLTGIGDALRDALAAHRGQPLAGIVLLTEGRSNTGEDPRQVAAQAARDGVPIFVLAVGTEDKPRNARLLDLEVSPVVFQRDPVELAAVVETQGLRDATASVVLEQRGAEGDWRELAREPVTLGEDATLQRVVFRYTPETLGQIDFRATIEDVGAELSLTDNAVAKTIRVARPGIRVLMVAGYPAPEVQFLRNALLRDTSLEFASWLQTASEGYEHIGHRPLRRLPATLEELERYDVLVLFDPNMQELGPSWPEMLTRFVGDRGGGLVFIAGEQHAQRLFSSSGNGGDASWLRILPVVRDPGLYQSAADVRLSSRETYTFELTPAGTADPIFHFVDDPYRNREVLTSLPGMYWHFPVTRARPGATVLARHGDPRMRNEYGRHVLLASQYYGPGRTVFIGFDSTYRWRYLHEDYFDGFWARLVDRVGRNKALGGRFPFTLATDRGAYRAGDRITVRAEMVDADVSSPAELHGQWELAGGDAVVDLELTPLADRPGVLEGSFLAGESGSYTVRVLPGGPAEPDMAARPATLTLRVEPPRQEIDNPTLDKLLLEEIAQVSGGAIFTLTNADELPAAIQVRQVERVLEYRDEVWDAPLLSGLIVLLLTAEWLLRKKHRMA